MKTTISLCAALGCVGPLVGCANNQATPHATVRPAACPDTGQSTEQRLREIHSLNSSPVLSGPLAPTGVRWTTICTGAGSKVLKGGPLDSALNSAAPYQGQACSTVSVTPVPVMLRYVDFTRRFIIDMGGCPGVVLNNGTKLTFAVDNSAVDELRLTAAILRSP